MFENPFFWMAVTVIAFIFFVGTKAKPMPGKFPYQLRKALMTKNELNAYWMITGIVGGQLAVFCKVRIADFISVNKSAKNDRGYFNRISQKHIDFLLCHPETSAPICGIEWDDSSHNTPKAKARDETVEKIYDAAEFPLLRFKTNATYEEIAMALSPYL